MQKEDAYIIHECLNGEPEAFGFLVDRYKESVYALAHSKLHDFQDAEDVTQEVFIKAYQKLKTLKQWDSFYAWLYAITSNTCKNWLKKRSERPDQELIEDKDLKILEDHSLDSYHESLVQESLLGMIEDALCSLPEIYRQVITLYYLGGMSNKEIASFLGVAPTAIKERLSRARMQLKEEIIAMMSATFDQQRLKAGFTFHIVEAIKKIKIHPVSTMKGLPWGLSLATGIIITIMSINPALISFEKVGTPIFSPMPVESKVMKVGEIPVDVIKASNIAFISNNIGKGNGGEPKQPNMQNGFFMDPHGEGGKWAVKADMPTARVDLQACAVDGIIYAIGGRSDNILPTVEAYNPKTDTWTRKADMPTTRQGLSTSVVDGIIYAIGGYGPAGPKGYLSTVEAYDPKTDTWTKKTNMAIEKDWASAGVVDGIIYVIGGWNETVLSTVEAYDPKTDKWTKKTDMPTPRFSFSTGVVNGIIYAIGGQNINGTVFSTVEAYNPKTNEWSKKADMPTERVSHSASVVNGKIYVIGGGTFDRFSPEIEEYNPMTDTWTRKSNMPTDRGYFSTSVVNGKIYAIGGGESWNVALDKGIVEEYTPEGWPFSISPQGKLPNTWGKLKVK